jgi:acyl-CoA thioesterase
MMDWTPSGLLAADPHAQGLGVVLVAEEPLTLQLVVEVRHTNFLGIVHGGVVYSLADVALSVATNSGGTRSVMIDSHVVLTAPSEPGDVITATVETITSGRTMASHRITVTRGDGRVVANFTGTVLRRPA